MSKIMVLKAFSLLAGTLLMACGEEAVSPPIIKTVMAVKPSAANEQATRILSGVLHPVDESVLSFEIPGVIQQVNVNLGDRFVKGDVLVTIENTLFELAVRQREGHLSEAKSRLTEAELDFKRKKQLVSSGAVSQAEVDVAQARYNSLIDQVEIAQTQVAIAYEDLADTQLVAPYDGSVAIRHIEPSQQISPSSPILTIQGSDALEVSVLVPETMISHIQTGDTVLVDVVTNRERQSLRGVVFERGKQAQRANAFPVTVSLDPTTTARANGTLQSGMSAEVTFSRIAKDVPPGSLKAPLSSVAADNQNSHFVMALVSAENNNSKVVKVSVNVHEFTSDYVIFTPSSELTSIVRTGVDFVRDGQIVKIADAYPRSINP